MSPLDDQWELYDLTTDPIEARNRWTDPDLHELRQQLRTQLKLARAEAIPERNSPGRTLLADRVSLPAGLYRLPPFASACCHG